MIFLLLLTFILAPTYVIRFSLFHLPTNLLMVWVFLFWIIFGLWLIKNKKVRDFINFKLSVNKKILIPLTLFFFSGLVSLFVGGTDRAKLGQFIVLFLQPISVFFIAGYILREFPRTKSLVLGSCYLVFAMAGLYAIIQYFSLWGLPSAWWGNSVEPKRAIAFFVHPNFYALWSAPLLAFLIPDVFSAASLPLTHSVKTQGHPELAEVVTGRVREGWQSWIKIVTWSLGALGLLLSLSRSGWLGLGVAILVYLIVAADNKIRKIALVCAAIAIAVIVYYPNLRYRFITPFYGEKSSNSRIELWTDGFKAIKQSPTLGLGLTGFAKNYGVLNTDPSLDTHNFPHNIFLNFWVETGLLGLISFIWLISIYIYRGLKATTPSAAQPPLLSQEGNTPQLSKDNRGASPPNIELTPDLIRGGVPSAAGGGGIDNRTMQLAISFFLLALLTQGLLDNPYFKNDLALVFWIILALGLI